MNKNITLYGFLFFLLILQIFFSIFFSIQFNYPDGVLHYKAFRNNYSISIPSSFLDYISNFDLYNLSIIKNTFMQLFPNVYKDCYMVEPNTFDHLFDSCDNQFLYNKSFSFGGGVNLYSSAKPTYLNYDKISLLIYLFSLVAITFFIVSRLNDVNIIYTLILFLFFPSTLNNISYISPNIASTFFQILIFILFINKRFLLYLLFSLLLLIIDYQNLINVILILVFISYYLLCYLLNLKLKFITIVIIIFMITIFIFLLKQYGIIEYIIWNFLGVSLHQNYTYLNIGEDNNIIKSIIIFLTSLYFMGGSMSHPSYLLEYLIFFVILLYFINTNMFNKFNIDNLDSNILSFSYFVFSSTSVLWLLIVFSNFNQGRYGLLILIPIFYYFSSYFKSNKFIFLSVITVIIIFNNYKTLSFLRTSII